MPGVVDDRRIRAGGDISETSDSLAQFGNADIGPKLDVVKTRFSEHVRDRSRIIDRIWQPGGVPVVGISYDESYASFSMCI
jgi:hypothetical protein